MGFDLSLAGPFSVYRYELYQAMPWLLCCCMNFTRWNGEHPECLSLDGKTCWKTRPNSCQAKLKQLPQLKSAGKVKQLACGPAHKAAWGTTGYSEGGSHWCTVMLKVLTTAGTLKALHSWQAHVAIAHQHCLECRALIS